MVLTTIGQLGSLMDVRESSDVYEARQVAARLGAAVGLDEEAVGRAQLVTSELATNLTRYGQAGRMLIGSAPRAR